MLGTLHILYDNFWLLYFATVEFNQRSQKIDIYLAENTTSVYGKRTRQGVQHGFDTAAYTQTDPPRAAPHRGRSLISTITLLPVELSLVTVREGGATTWPSRHLLMTGAPVWWRAAPRRYKQINSSRTRRSVGELSAARTTADSTACWLHFTFTSTRTGRLSTGPWKHDPLISADKKLCSWSYAH